MSELAAANISHFLAILNGLISASQHADEYRAMVSLALSEGRDISNEELAAISQRVKTELDNKLPENPA